MKTLTKVLLPLSVLFSILVVLPVQAGEYRLVTSYMSPWIMPGNGEHPGSFIELMREVDRRMGNEHLVEYHPWARAQRIAQEENNIVIFPMTRLKEREELYNWLEPIQEVKLSFVSTQKRIESLDEAKTLKRIIVHKNAPPAIILQKMGFKNLVLVQEVTPQILQMLVNGRADAWFSAEDMAQWVWKLNPQISNLYFSEPVLKNNLYVATSKQMSQKTSDKLRQVLTEMKKDGFLDKLFKRYVR